MRSRHPQQAIIDIFKKKSLAAHWVLLGQGWPDSLSGREKIR